MKKQRNLFQVTKCDKALGRSLNEMEINNLVDKEVKVMVIKKLAELGRRMDEHSENFKKEMGNIRNCQIEATELKHTITDLKNNRRVQQQTR